jgi:geranylgeranyl pyrophosphate synthase
LEVMQEAEKKKLKKYLSNISHKPGNKEEIIQLLDRNGAVLYMFSEIERHSGLALTGLEKANATAPAVEKLKEIITKLIPSV